MTLVPAWAGRLSADPGVYPIRVEYVDAVDRVDRVDFVDAPSRGG